MKASSICFISSWATFFVEKAGATRGFPVRTMTNKDYVYILVYVPASPAEDVLRSVAYTPTPQ